MAAAPTFLEPTIALHGREDIYQWLRDQADRLGLHVVLSEEDARMQSGYLYLSIYIREARDPYDFAVKSQMLEDTWNDQEPQPDPPIYLTPEKSPEQRAIWQRAVRSSSRWHSSDCARRVWKNFRRKKSIMLCMGLTAQPRGLAHTSWQRQTSNQD